MIDPKVIESLRVLAKQVKGIMAGVSGQVVFNCSRDAKHEPKVSVMVADVTEVKK